MRKNIPFPEKRDIFILFSARELVTDKVFHLACDPLCFFGQFFSLFGFGHKAGKTDGGGDSCDVAIKGGVASSSVAHLFFSFRGLLLVCPRTRRLCTVLDFFLDLFLVF